MRITDEQVWAGTEASLQAALSAEEAKATRIAAGGAWGEPPDEDERSRLVTVQDGIAFVSIKGTLNNSADVWWNEYIGATGYPEIRDAMIELAHDAEVKHIVLDVDSGGGAVAGVSDTGDLIRLVHDKVKPVTAFTGGNMMSAAYWLGSAAGSVYATQGAGVGSVGIIATHMERSEMLKAAGIGVNVIRAGKYKALANSVEPLSAEGRAQIQASVDASYKIFATHVATMRGKSYEFVDSVMAQGREFYGQAAADASLVDGITTFDALVSGLKEKLMDRSVNSMDNRAKQAHGMRVESQGEVMSKKTLSEQDIAAIAAGAALGATSAPDAAAQAAAVAQAAADAAQAETDAAAAQAAADAAAATQQVDTSTSTIRFVSEQLKASQDELLNARLDLAKVQAKFDELTAVVTPLRDIAAKATNNMRVACRAAVMDFSAMSPAQVLAEHQAIVPTFQGQYPVGGVASVDAGADKTTKNEHKVDALTQARLKAVRF